MVAAITTEIFVPYFLQTIHGFSPLAAGYMTAAMAGLDGGHASAPRATARAPRRPDWGRRPGARLALAALAGWAGHLLATASWIAAAWRLAGGALALAAVGFGIGLGWPHLLTRVFNAAPAAGNPDLLVHHHRAALCDG